MNPQVLSSQSSFLVTFIASFLIWLMFFGVGVLWFVDGRSKKEQALHAIFSIIVAWSIVFILKTLFPTLRPFELNGNLPLTLTIPKDSSFPSSHSTIAFALATSVYLHNKRSGAFFLTCALFVALGRVFSNVHSVLDVGMGSFIGIIVAYTIRRLHLFRALK